MLGLTYYSFLYQSQFETRQNLSRLEGQTSISSDDFFGGGGQKSRKQNYSSTAPDFQDIKDGVKQGVTKVAGKISSLANGVMNTLQVGLFEDNSGLWVFF